MRVLGDGMDVLERDALLQDNAKLVARSREVLRRQQPEDSAPVGDGRPGIRTNISLLLRRQPPRCAFQVLHQQLQRVVILIANGLSRLPICAIQDHIC